MSQPFPKPAVEIVTDVELVDSHPQHSTLQNSIIERMLSPQSLQVMMMSGGGILAIGFAVWLWSIGMFDNPLIAAISLGAANLGLLFAGVLLVTKTRFKLAGRGLAFLSSLLLPLHLWFYDAQGLIEVANGGHLWIPALVFCGLYALVARLTRDSIFVYNLLGGVVLTGLLFLASPQLAFLWNVIPTCAFLISVGAISVHADRLFIEKSGAFSRQQFGLAFFRAGQIVMFGGLAYLLFSQTFVVFFDGLLRVGEFSIGQNPHVNIWSLPILAAAGWTYAFSHSSRPRGNAYLAATGVIAIWIGLTALNVFSIELTVNLIFLLIAAGLLTLQVVLGLLDRFAADKTESGKQIVGHDSPLVSAGNFMLTLVGFVQAIAALLLPDMFLNTTYLFQAIVTVASLWATTEIGLGEKDSVMSNVRISIGSLLLTLASLLTVLHWTTLGFELAIGAVLAGVVVLAVISQVVSSPRNQRVLQLILGNATGGILLAVSLLMLAEEVVFGSIAGLAIVLTCAGLLAMISMITRSRATGVGSFIALAISLAQVAVLLNVTSAMPIIISISILGVLTMFGAALSRKIAAGNQQRNVAALSWADQIGSSLVIGGSVAAILFVVPLLCLDQATGIHAAFLLFQLLPLGIVYLLNRVEAWRHSFQAMAVAVSICAVVTFAAASTIPFIYRIEIMALVTGGVLLALGHLGWAKEERALTVANHGSDSLPLKRSEAVSISLTLGGLLIAIPMVIGVVAFRIFGVESADFWRVFHEVGGLAMGLTLLGSGILCRIRSTTLSGAAVITSYVVTLLVLVRLPDELQSISVLMMIGGGAFFGIAILLSIYRDWLLGLPSKIRDGDGVFKVLKWR